MKSIFKPLAKPSSAGQTLVVWGWFVVAFVVWVFSSFTNQFIPSPKQVFARWLFLIREESLLYELYVSFTTNVEALLITAILSLLLSYLVVLPVMRPFIAFCSKARFFGLTGFVIVFTLIFGGSHWLKVALLVFGMTVFFVTSMSSAILEIPQDEFDYAKTLRLSNFKIIWEVIILGKFDYALETMRQNAAIGWVMLTMVEGLNRSEGGLGALMLNENKHFKLDAVFAIQLTILFLGIAQDAGLRYIRSLICPYAELQTEKK